ncbi:mucin-binding protein [Secundilactobacillus paracollinoides]|uniref:Gram-positive cocci surface proteins LPxTG domain-containing protein n=1 Tax=Secundilactobacillus paracollinoides TaxID=240427 RepID=A0A1B2IXE6_9LACO|nr:KxYKxGKxW signal peptide domain-containing protein [Secundilactobacillus paracollinoides]ANZ66764.1 hypothetical protein AYR63_06200 [Secundilactobacillus paracollinoides]
MVGKNNRVKDVATNEKKHYKDYKSGKRWVFASIASLSLGTALFFGSGLTTYADSSTPSNSTDTLSDSTADAAAATSSTNKVTLTSPSTGSSDTSNSADTSSDTTATADSDTSSSTVADSDSSSSDSSVGSSVEDDTQASQSDTDTTAANKVTTTDTGSTTATSKPNSATTKSTTATNNGVTNDQITDSTPATDITTDASTVDDTSTGDGSDKTVSSDTVDNVTGEVLDTPTISTDSLAVNSETIINPTDADIDTAKETMEAAYKLTGQAQQLNMMLDEATPSETSATVTLTSDTTTVGYETGVTAITLTLTATGAETGDTYSVTIPTTSVLGYDGIDPLSANQGTVTTTKTADGTIVTDTIVKNTADMSQQITLWVSNNYAAKPEPIADVGTGVYNITLAVNGTTTTTIPITQTVTPTINLDPITRTSPDTTNVPAVQPNTDYVYDFDVNESEGLINNGYQTKQVNSNVNYGTTITIPVPEGFTLDSTLTDSLNNFNDATTITQSAAGADIIITVPKGSGKQGWEGQNGYQIAGSYGVTQTADDQTLTAAGPIQFSQVISADGATLDGTGSTMSETIAGISDIASVSGISVSIGGNSYGAGAQNQLTLSTDPADATSYLATYGLSSMIASALTDDAVVTISVPDGIKMSSLTVPDSGANSSQYLTGTTQYSYTVTLADGTTQEGVVDAGGEITAAAGTTIRSIALTPNYLSSGAYTVGANHGTDSGFVLSGSVSQTYDNGNAVQVGDEINFGISVTLASDPTTVIASQTYTETISVPIDGVYAYMWQPADGQVAGKVYAGRISVGRTGGNKHTTDNVYEPTFYYVLPSGTSIYGMSGISDDAKVTEYLSDDGRTVVEVDYSGTGESVNTDSTGPVQIDLSNNPDALPGEYPFSMYVYSPTTALTNGTKVTDTSYTNGNADAYLMIGGDMNWTISSASVFDEYSFAQGNQDVTGISAGTSDDQGTDDATFYTTLINTVADGADNTATSVINLPTDGDASGSGYTFDLTGPVTLPTNYITSTGTGDAIQGTVLYSTSAQTVTNGQAAPDTTGYVTADEIGDNWSSVRSIMIEVDNVAKGTSTGRIAINGTIENMENLAGQTGYLSTAVFVNGNSASTEAKAASIAITGTSSVTTRFHYVDADGNDQYITLDDLAQNDLQDNVDTLKDIYPTSLDGFSAADQALIPEGYTLASDDYTLVSGPNADGIESTATTKVGDTAIYSTDGEIVQYELAKSADLTVTYVDDDNGGSTVGDVATVSGVLGTSGSYQTTTPTGYDLASGQASTLAYTLTDDDTDNLTVHLVHNITTTGTVTTTNTVTYTGLPADKTPATQTADVTWAIETDDVTGQTTYVPSTAGTTTYQTTNVAGYSFDPSQAEVSFTTASQSDAPTDQNTEVAYTADKQATDIEFVDDDENGASVGDSTALNGTTDQAVDWTAAVPDNYDLAKNQSASGTYTFQATDNAPIVIHLVHQHTTTSMTTTDTVSYTGLPSDRTVSDNSATVNWTVDTDQVTNTVTYTTATPTTEIASPTVTGYTAADPSVTFTQSASTTTEPVDQQQTVNYTPNATSFTVSYVDDDNGGAQVGQPATVNGTTDETGAYTVDVPAGYQLAAQQDVTIGADNTVAYTLPTDNMTIHLTHKHAVSTTTTTNTVTYAGLPETKTPSDDVSTVTWNVDTDEATDTTVYTPDNATTTVSVPTIDGYTAAANEVTFTQGTTPENQTKTVTYTADPESLTVTYVDDDSSDEAQVGNTVTLTGNMDDTGTYTVTIPTGYALTAGQTEISDANTIAYTLTNDDSDNLTIHLSHVHTSSTVTTTDTVTYTGLPTDKAQTPKTVAVDWTVDTDEATGQSTYTPSVTSTVIDSPIVDGYAPASTTTDFPQETITDVPTDQTTTVAYTATGQSLTVTYVDDTTGDTMTNLGGTLTGVTDETGTYTVQVPTNYVLSDGQTAEVAYAFTTDNTDNLTIHLSHGIATGTATTTRNVYFVVQGDNALNPDPVQQTAMWNVTEDMVTGAVTATTTDSYGQVYTPAVSGYTANTTTVPSETLGTINTLPTNAEDAFVTYAADPQTATVEYIDDDNGEKTVGTPTTLNGVTGTTTDWNTTDLLTGYHLATDQAAALMNLRLAMIKLSRSTWRIRIHNRQ